MNRQELKDALIDLHLNEPEFFNDLIGKVIRENLCIDKDFYGRDYDSGPSYHLLWENQNFSTA